MTAQPHRHRHQRPDSRWQKIWRQFGFEIVIGAVMALGVFLLFERMNIRTTLFRWLRAGIAAAVRGVGRVDDLARVALQRLTLSDAIGIVLILGALLAIVLRVRWQLMHRPTLIALTCPACGAGLHQVHRHSFERLISWYVPLRRYRCSNRDCGWEGLKVKASRLSGGRFLRVGKGEVLVYIFLALLVAILMGLQLSVRDAGATRLALNPTVSRLEL